MSPVNLEWINSGLSNPDYNDATRRNIRSHAMKRAAAARGNNGSWGKHNMRQFLVVRYETPPGCPEEQRSAMHTSRTSRTRSSSAAGHVLARPMPLSGLERLTAETGINVLDLNELTHLHMGHAAGTILSSQPGLLSKLMGCRRESFLAHVPARFGHTPSLDDAVRCVAMKAKRFLVPDYVVATKAELSLYGKALRSLQAAVNSDTSCFSPDVLCAVQVLSFYELLDFPSRSRAWEHHIAAAMRLMSARGSNRFTTDYEKGLLLSMVGPIICESLRTGSPCFLEDDDWKALLLATAKPDGLFTPTSQIAVRLEVLCTATPRLFSEVASAVFVPDAVTQDILDRIEAELERLERQLLEWRHDFQELIKACPEASYSTAERDHREQVDAASLGILAFVCRLMSAISTDRESPEARSIAYVTQMLKRIQRVPPNNPWAEFYLGQKVILPDTILNSSESWLKPSPKQARVVEKWKFQAWADLLAGKFEVKKASNSA